MAILGFTDQDRPVLVFLDESAGYGSAGITILPNNMRLDEAGGLLVDAPTSLGGDGYRHWVPLRLIKEIKQLLPPDIT